MSNEHVVIVSLALLIFYMAFGGWAGGIAAGLSAVMMVGALRHPDIATSRPMEGTPEETLHATMLLVALIIFVPMLWGCVAAFRRGGR